MKHHTRSTCLGCGSGALALLLDYGEMPLAGGFLAPEEMDHQEAFPLRLARCADCTLMQILDVVPPEEIFHHYSYASSTTRTLTEHFAAMGPEIVRAAGAAGRLAVEFGCNDGVLVRPMLEAGATVVGIDPSDVARRASAEQGWPLYGEFFDAHVAARVRDTHGPARLVTGNNVFAHVEDLHAILDGVTTLLEDDGLFVFEVQYQGELLRLFQFDTVYHEHICYHSLTSLVHLLGRHGLRIVAARPIPIHSGSIRVTAAWRDARRPVAPSVEIMLAAERHWNVERFVAGVAVRRDSIRTLAADLAAAGRRVAGYGAAGRATILMNYCALTRDVVPYVLDMSPLRYGRLVPGVLTPIVAPSVFHAAPPHYAIMTAWNYEAEIVAKEKDFVTGGGRFIVPLPDVRLVGAA
jgi:novobiocin biosynthesis protein NovU/D-mycarose 3-C-methyltransferase